MKEVATHLPVFSVAVANTEDHFLTFACDAEHGHDRAFADVGGGGPTTDAPLLTPAISHDIIRFYPKTKERIFDVCAPLYEQGLSLREIERQTGFAKSSIRETLTDRGLPLRAFSKDQGERSSKPECMRSGAIPFGYAYLDGKLTVDHRTNSE